MFPGTKFLLGSISKTNFMVIKCPKCFKNNYQILEATVLDDGFSVKRRRSCKDCGAHWTTYERIEVSCNSTNCGSGNHNSVLLEKDVKQMRSEFNNGANFQELARKYGVNRSTVSRIIRRSTWRHVV